MPTITTSSVFTYIGLLLILVGFFMVFAGLRIVSIEKVTVVPGARTWLLGLVLLAFGIGLLTIDLLGITSFPSRNTLLPSSTTRQFTFSVQAGQGWQNTGQTVSPGNNITIQYQSGTWTSERVSGNWHDGAGDLVARYKCADLVTDPLTCIEPMPAVYKGTLIGKIGDDAFEVGNRVSLRANVSGSLQLRMNDGDEGLYDNGGEITVLITID